MYTWKVWKKLFTDKLFKCQICDKSYSNKHSLNQHMNIHDELKAFKCDVCMKIFDRKSRLIQHFRTHTGEKPFECKACNRKFTLKSHLVEHQATHSDVRNFKCSVCPDGKYFKTKYQLNQHIKLHFEPKFASS